MKSQPILTAVLVSLTVTVWAWVLQAKPGQWNGLLAILNAAPEEDDEAAEEAEEDSDVDPLQDGNDLVLQARQRLLQVRGVAAKMTQTVGMGDDAISLSGQYLQGTNLRLRMELIHTDPIVPGRLVQICDGQVLWTWKHLGETSEVTRSDVRQLIAERGGQPDPSAAPLELALGGLPALLTSLGSFVDFSEVRTESINGGDVLRLDGTWTEAAIKAWIKPDEGAVPILLPNRVRLYLDPETLFPRRLEYLHLFGDQASQSMMSLEWSEVRLNVPPNPKQFEFLPPDGVIPIDITRDYLKHMAEGLKGAQDGRND